MLWAGLATVSWGDTLTSQSSVGVSADYASNPFQLYSGAHPAESLAVLANLPATYTSDTQTFDLIPRVRFAETHGEVALLSNYQYLDGDWRWNSARNTITVNAGWHHDSTYYNAFENVALLGHDIRRLEQTGSASWEYLLTERSDLQLSGLWDKVAYSQNSASSVSNFSYAQGSAQYEHSLTEHWQWTDTVGYAHYQLLLSTYASDERFAQTGLKGTLSELWSLSAQVGYAYLTGHEQGLICCEIALNQYGQPYLIYIPVEETASRGSPNYAATLERKDERFVLDLAASRAIQPSGLGALLTQDDARIAVTVPWTERLSLGAALHYSRLTDSLDRLNLDRRYYNASLTASWQWSEYWTVQILGSYVQQDLTPQTPMVPGVTVYVTMLRQFGQLRL